MDAQQEAESSREKARKASRELLKARNDTSGGGHRFLRSCFSKTRTSNKSDLAFKNYLNM